MIGSVRRRVQTAAASIKRELADRNPHATGPLVTEAENALAVPHHDRFDIVEMRIGQDAVDTVLMRYAQKKAARLAENAAELLAAEAHGRCVDDRQQFAAGCATSRA